MPAVLLLLPLCNCAVAINVRETIISERERNFENAEGFKILSRIYNTRTIDFVHMCVCMCVCARARVVDENKI